MPLTACPYLFSISRYLIFFTNFSPITHLEMVQDYSSEAFIGAFHRFTSRRGHCSLLLSDEGTTFVGADAILREMFRKSSQHFKQNALTLANLGTTWNANLGTTPPAALTLVEFRSRLWSPLSIISSALSAIKYWPLWSTAPFCVV